MGKLKSIMVVLAVLCIVLSSSPVNGLTFYNEDVMPEFVIPQETVSETPEVTERVTEPTEVQIDVTEPTEGYTEPTEEVTEPTVTEETVDKGNEVATTPTEPAEVETEPAEDKEETVATEPAQEVVKVTPSGSTFYFSLDGYSESEREALSQLMSTINENLGTDASDITFYLNSSLTSEQYRKLASYLYIKYGGDSRIKHEAFDYVSYTDGDLSQSYYITVHMNNIREYYATYSMCYNKAYSIVSGLKDGSEEYILSQITEYLANNTSYNDNYKTAYDVLYNGLGSCNGYALAFNMLANMAGIRSEMCIGKVGGVYHAWNRVILSDGSCRYYDVTFYDTGSRESIYVGSASNFHGNFLINNYADCWYGV